MRGKIGDADSRIGNKRGQNGAIEPIEIGGGGIVRSSWLFALLICISPRRRNCNCRNAAWIEA
jgi:hypothetical protein